jgi:hypothetical protein
MVNWEKGELSTMPEMEFDWQCTLKIRVWKPSLVKPENLQIAFDLPNEE